MTHESIAWSQNEEIKIINNRKDDKEWLKGYIKGATKRRNWVQMDGKSIIYHARLLLKKIP